MSYSTEPYSLYKARWKKKIVYIEWNFFLISIFQVSTILLASAECLYPFPIQTLLWFSTGHLFSFSFAFLQPKEKKNHEKDVSGLRNMAMIKNTKPILSVKYSFKVSKVNTKYMYYLYSCKYLPSKQLHLFFWLLVLAEMEY